MLLALGLSVSLWTIVTTQQNPDIVDVFQAIPVELRNPPSGLTVRNDVQSIRLVVAAPRDVWPELRPAKFQASVDLSRVGPGVQELPVEVYSIDSRVLVQEVSPQKVIVQLELIRRKEVPVRARILGEVPAGYIVRTPRITPELITVTGPQSLVEQVVDGTVEVSLIGARNSLNQVYKVAPFNSAGERVERVAFTPENVVVEVPIEQERAFKTVPISAQLTGSLAVGYQVVGIRVEPNTLTIEGEPRTIESLNVIQTLPIDLNNATGDVSLNVELSLPNGIRLARTQPVLVRILVAAVVGNKVLDVVATIQNVGDGRRASTSPATVRLTISGPMPALSSLAITDVKVTVDATGLSAGNHALRPRIDVPSLVRVQSLEPDRVNLQIIAIPTPVPTATPVPSPEPSPTTKPS